MRRLPGDDVAARGAARLKTTRIATRIRRIARLTLHIVGALALGAFVFPFVDSARHAWHVKRWSARFMRILALRIEVTGTLPRRGGPPAMIVANHVTWLDIFALNAAHPVRFVANSEIRRWPLLGWIAHIARSLFIDQRRRHHVAEINRQVEAGLRAGDTFAVFPEGGVNDGETLRAFHASLLQPALACDALLHPVAIRYVRADGSRCREVAYDGDKTMLDVLRLILTQPVIHARLEFLQPIACSGRTRRDLAAEAQALIARAVASSPDAHTSRTHHHPA